MDPLHEGDGAESLGKPRPLQFPMESTRLEVTAQQGIPKVGGQSVLSECSAEDWGHMSCEETTRGQEKNDLRGLEGTGPVLTQGQEQCLFPPVGLES